MNTKFTLKNFRIFDSKGVTLDLKPITLLTGCNSSGKSSVVKALVLLSDYFSGLKEDYEFCARGRNDIYYADFKSWLSSTNSKMDFAKEPQRLLGKFSKVLNEGSDCDIVTMELDMHSYLMAQDVHLVFEFKEDPKDEFLGYLHSLKVSKQNGELILTLDSTALEITQSSLLPEFFSSIFERYFFKWQDDILSSYITEEEQKEAFDVFTKKADSFSEKWGIDIEEEYVNGAGIFMEYIPHYDNYVLKIAGMKILHYLPILKEKLSGTKDESLIFLKEALENEDISNDEVKAVLTATAKSFFDSEEKDFLSWYRRIEREYFQSQTEKCLSSEEFYYLSRSPEYDCWWCYRVEDEQKYIRLQKKFAKLKEPNDVDSQFNNKDNRFFLDERENDGQVNKESRPISFGKVFALMEYLSFIYMTNDLDMYECEPRGLLKLSKGVLSFKSKMVNDFYRYEGSVLKEIILETIAWTTRYAGTSAVNVKRLYALSEDDEFTRLLRRYNAARKTKKDEAVADSFVNKWIKKFGVGDYISIEVDSEGLGMTLRLHRDSNDTKGVLLADCGYGITQLLSVLLNIEVEIMESKYYTRTSLNFDEEFYISKEDYLSRLKVVSEMVDKNYSLYNCTIAIEEPENHLHPRYQSLLADMFYDAYKNYGIHFVIETHSEYLIRRTQVLVAQEKHETDEEVENRCPFATYYVPKNGEPYSLKYRKDGKFKEEFGSGFYDEASNLAFEIL